MTPTDPIEGLLRGLSLELPEQGDHLDDERLAEIAEGADPTPAEAAHLAGCDACCEILIMLGEGLAELAEAETPVSASPSTQTIHPFPSRSRRGRWSVGGVVLAMAGAAAAAWGVYSWTAASPTDPQSRIEKAQTAPAIPVQAPMPKVEDRPAEPGETVAPLPSTAPTPNPTSAQEAASAASAPPVPTALPSVDVAETVPPKPRPRKRRPPPPTAEMEAPPGTLSGRRGPRPVNRMPVNGEPRGFGSLRLNAKPSARVYVDGKDYGWTPLLNLRLPSGPHDVRLVYESPLAAEKEQRFRVLIQDDETWSTVRDNRLRK